MLRTKPPASNWFDVPGPLRKIHCRPTQGRYRHFSSGLSDTGWLAACWTYDLEVILQVLADAGQVMDERDIGGAEVLAVADAGDLQQLRRVERAAAQDHLTGAHRRVAAPRQVRYSTPTAVRAVETHPHARSLA